MLALICVGAGLLCLLFEVIHPDRALHLTRSFANGSSWMARGAWIAASAIVVFLIQGVLSLDFVRRWIKGHITLYVLNILVVCMGCLVGLGLCLYTGVLLMHAYGVPFWSTPLLPVLFLASALSAAMSTMILVATGFGMGRKHKGGKRNRRLVGAMALFSVAEGIVLVAYLGSMLGAGGEGASPDGMAAAYSARLLLQGSYAVLFWGCVVMGGLVIPLVLALISMRLSERSAWICLAVGAPFSILGDCMLRFLMLSVAARPDYLADALMQVL